MIKLLKVVSLQSNSQKVEKERNKVTKNITLYFLKIINNHNDSVQNL